MYAQADDPDGTLEWVRFFVNGEVCAVRKPHISNSIGTTGYRSYPYSEFEWTNTKCEAGSYSFFAIPPWIIVAMG